MKDRQIKRVVCHQGIQLGNKVVTSVSKVKDACTIEMWPMGVHVKGKDTQQNAFETVITYNMIHQFDLEPEEKTQKK